MIELSEVKKKIIDTMGLSQYFYLDMIDKIIIKYLETSILDINLLKEELDKLDQNQEMARIKDEFFNLEKLNRVSSNINVNHSSLIGFFVE